MIANKASVFILILWTVSVAHASFSIKTVNGIRREIKSWVNENGDTVMISNAVTKLESSVMPDLDEGKRKKRSVSALSAVDEQKSLDKHNVLRKGEGSSDMRHMVWNAEMATMAQAWADACDFVHGQPNQTHSNYSSLGQNLFMTTGSSIDVESAIQAWFNEKSMYNYDTKACTGVCGHYTQVVWANSFEVGCGVKTCTPLRDTEYNQQWPTGTYYVCNYGPSGNYQGASPYSKGPACSKCYSGVFNCYDSMCKDDCSGVNCECKANTTCKNCANATSSCSCSCADGWTGVTCSDECKDYHANCNNGWYSNWCEASRPYVLSGCPLMCNLCNVKTASTPPCAEEVDNSGSTAPMFGNSACFKLTTIALTIFVTLVLF